MNIERTHIINVGAQIRDNGIPNENVWSRYYVVIDGSEYPFNYVVNQSHKIASGDTELLESDEFLRNHIEKLGFEITYYEGGYNFFTKDELEFYSSIVNTDYRVANPAHEHYQRKLYPIIAKAKYWAEQIKPDHFYLRKDGNWLNGHVAKIKPYFWPRVYSDEDQDVFFNVEVNGSEEFIGYKLDGYFETKKALPEHKIEFLQEYKKLIKWEWPQISFENLHEYNWDRLLTESREYIQKYLVHHDYLKKVFSKESKIARITWNTNGWVKPSGQVGKSVNPSYEFENGFGHEEWLFDGDKIIDGYKYGFLEPIHKSRIKYEGKMYDFSLYTRDRDTGKNFWVANLRDVEILSSIDAQGILEVYKKNGWYEEMKKDLYELNIDSLLLDKWIENGAEQLFNIRFKASQLNEISPDLIPVNENEILSNRYILMDIPLEIKSRIEKEIKTGFSFDASGSKEAELSTASKRKSQRREIELELKHNILQTKLLNYLQNKYGKDIVKRECTAFGASRVDIVRKTETGYVFYEIKTYNSLKSSLREGIGQLLEYCLYPDVNEAESLVLVSHVSPSQEIIQYINQIKNIIKIPFVYIHFDADKGEIISEI